VVVRSDVAQGVRGEVLDTGKSNELNQVARGVAWVAGGTVLAGALNYVYVLLLTHRLEPGLYAKFAASQALLLVAGTVANVTVPWTLARQIRHEPDAVARQRSVRQAFCVNAVLGSAFAVGGAAVAAHFLSPAPLSALAASAFAFFIASTAMGYAQGQARFRLLATLVVGEVLIKVAVGVGLVALGAGVFGAVGANAVGAVAILCVGAVVMRGDLRRALGPRRASVGALRRDLWRASITMAAIQGLATTATVFNAVLILAVLPAGQAVAAFQLADTVGRAPVFLSLALATVVFPALHSQVRSSDNGRIVGHGLRGLLVLAVAAWCGLATIPPALVRVVAPASYVASLHYLPITAGSGACWAVVTYLACCLRSERRARPACVGVICLLGCDGLALAVFGHHLNAEGVATLELATALASVAVVAVVAAATWGVGVLRTAVPAFLVGPLFGVLVLARHVPQLWVAVALVGGSAAVVASFPQPRFLRSMVRTSRDVAG
jgi:O-antigen/teichoic acid export membrane protein